ncbi:MAG: hypothetical protein C0498_08385 [Anaerolinea sp.]|nr:hypothetical protein [Anaerolinea sp.]
MLVASLTTTAVEPGVPETAPRFESEPSAAVQASEPESAAAAAAAAPEAESLIAAVAEPSEVAIAVDGITSGGIVPGSYLPPSTVHRPVRDTTGAGPGTTPTAMVAPPAPAPGPVAAARPVAPGRASILADLPFDAPDEIEGWLVTLGGGISILGFFLPWRSTFMTGIDGYFDSWGLGVGLHLPIFVALVVVTALAVLPNRVASWARTGVCGMVGGGILFGLVWLYLEGGSSQLGALLAAVGAVLLVAGGIIAVAPGRSSHGREDA